MTIPAIAAEARPLLKTLPRIASRLLREATQHAATVHGIDRLEAEDHYQAGRSALAHLLAHERYRQPFEEMFRDLKDAHVRLVSHSETERVYGRAWVARLEAKMAELEREVARLPELERTDQRRIEIFLTVMDRLIALYQEGNWDLTDVQNPELYMLGRLVAKNFQAFDKKLNT